MTYRNHDGGFGQALEPDCRTPHSQPAATRFALATLTAVDRLTPDVALDTLTWLVSVTAAGGGVPFCLPTVAGFPRAPGWEPQAERPV